MEMDDAKIMRTGIIDLGTNTFNLLLNEIKGQEYKVLHKNKISVKLGEGGITKGIIAPSAYKRGLEALKSHKKTLKKFKVHYIYAVATSAIRSASNGHKFVEDVKKILDIDIHVINGEEEADLIYNGVKQAIDLVDNPKLIVDIGGGSTEFIIANSKEIFWRKSYQLGAARLLEMFDPQDPISGNDVASIEHHLSNSLKDMMEYAETYEVDCLIGSSGSFDTLAEMISRKNGLQIDWKQNTSFDFKMHEYNEIQHLIYLSTLKERLNMDGLIPMRADMIVISVVIINFILNKLPIQTMHLSNYALKEGLINQLLRTPDKWQKYL